MKKLIPTIIALSILFFITGLNVPTRKIEDGIYTGNFKVVYPTGTYTGKTTLVLSHSTFTCRGNARRIPAGGSGTYSIHENENKITFQDENIWTADFDWNLILTGEYDYSFDGKKLKLSKNKKGLGYYEYRLTKK